MSHRQQNSMTMSYHAQHFTLGCFQAKLSHNVIQHQQVRMFIISKVPHYFAINPIRGPEHVL